MNGSIQLAESSRAIRVDSLNGGLHVGESARVEDDVTSVNGGIRVASGVSVGGDVSTRNGTIVLDRSRIDGSIETTNGDIHIGSGSHVKGGLRVHDAPLSFFGWRHRNPKIVIGPDVVIEGELRFDRDVDLYVSDRAQVGRIRGAEPKRFAGDEP